MTHEAYPALMAEARKQGRIAALAYTPVAEEDPVKSFNWFSACCEDASRIDRAFPGYYEEFTNGIAERRAEIEEQIA